MAESTDPTAMAEAVLELEASWPDAYDVEPGDRMIVGVAGLLLCALAGSLGGGEHRSALRDELADLTNKDGSE